MEQQKQKSDDGGVLIVMLLLMLLVGGGVGAWFLLKPKPEDTEEQEQGDPREQNGEIGGNQSYTLEEEEQISGGITDPTKSSTFDPNAEGKEIYIRSSEAQQMITELAKRLAQSNEVMGKLRRQHNIGRPFVGANYDSEQQGAIDWMFYDGFAGVVQRDTTTYPIFSTYETQNKGKEIRDQLQAVVNTDWSRMGLSEKRVGGEPWYITALNLNLFYGKRGVHTHTASQIRAYQADRGGLDMYKKINKHDVNDHRLTEYNGAWRENFPAGTVHTIARDWVAEIDRLDRAAKIEAQARLEQQGWKFTLVDNQTQA